MDTEETPERYYRYCTCELIRGSSCVAQQVRSLFLYYPGAYGMRFAAGHAATYMC